MNQARDMLPNPLKPSEAVIQHSSTHRNLESSPKEKNKPPSHRSPLRSAYPSPIRNPRFFSVSTPLT
ncbi:hypothetical protein COCC4DRAFT_68997 [Bipolaris maydis ATCC 48331]|uniref:Uncharacterized protein n=2 Tax=Cochliobolus heterostrophus TaxID=5016 RepID=N4X8W6_COCH4|nr:uncharacterized protein COCC4DRAFT_68997 [Bipolaris maydis ATCC 48331]ENI09489.1 hypothetical protein COCC4DRAFT_68997 [Bipolaris maydis ATCC 48331]